MSNQVTITLRGYDELVTGTTWKAGNPERPQHAGVTYQSLCNLVSLFADSAQVGAYFEVFRWYKYLGTKVTVVPGVRTPADPAYILNAGYSSSEDMAFDLGAFYAWCRAWNVPQTVPFNEVSHRGQVWDGDQYFLQDPYWHCVPCTQTSSVWCRPFAYADRVSFAVTDDHPNSDDAYLPEEDEDAPFKKALTNWNHASTRVWEDVWKPTKGYQTDATVVAASMPNYPLCFIRIPLLVRNAYSFRIWYSHVFSFRSSRVHPRQTPTSIDFDLGGGDVSHVNSSGYAGDLELVQ